MTPSLQITSESHEAEVDRSVWKILLLGFLGIVGSFATFSGFLRLISGLDNVYFWPTVLAFAFFLIVVILQVFFIKGLGKLSLIAFLEVAAALAVFPDKVYPETSVPLLIGAFVAFVFIVEAMKHGRNFVLNGIKLHFFETTRVFLPKIVTGFLIFLSVVLYLNYFEWGKFTEAMGRRLVSGTITASEPVARVIVPGISLNGTVRNLLRSLAAEKLSRTKLEIPGVSAGSPETDFRSLPQKDQNKFIDQATDQLLEVLKKQFVDLNPVQGTADFAYDIVAKYFNSFNSSSWILPLAVSFIFFFTVKSAFFLLYWFVALLAFIIFKILVVFGFAYFNLETRSREFTLLS
ncbi:MAG: hypothetical protein AAB377_00170 [Patescibacteria group bacterium]